jgi:hypothetical protein
VKRDLSRQKYSCETETLDDNSRLGCNTDAVLKSAKMGIAASVIGRNEVMKEKTERRRSM